MLRHHQCIFLLSVLFVLVYLPACASKSQAETATTHVKGSIGLAIKRVSDLSSQAHLPSLPTVKSINQDFRQLGNMQGSSLALRGLNAALLTNLLGNSASQRPLFSLQGQYVFALDPKGEVIAEAEIQADGSWDLEIANRLWENAQTLGLFQGYKSQDGYVCEKPLEYEESSGKTRQASFRFNAKELLATDRIEDLGAFHFHPETANPTAKNLSGSLEPGPELPISCNSKNIVSVEVKADFNWQTPAGFVESRLYESGLGFAIDTRDTQEPKLVNIAPLDADGQMAMRIHKPKGELVPLALVMSDAELSKLSNLDLRGVRMPLTPTFDLNAAIRYGSPEQPATVPVGDDGYRYDPSLTSGGMAILKGSVLKQGQAVQNALILGVIDSAEVIAFNLAISDADGNYELWLPATDQNLPYYVIALSEDAKSVGKPINVPPFRGDASELRYVLSSARAFEGADIHLREKSGEGSVSGDVSGTVTAPEGETVDGVRVRACSPDFTLCPVETTISASSQSAPFILEQVPAGDYIVMAQKDLDADGKVDLQGVYSKSNQPALLSPPASNLLIKLVDLRQNKSKAEVTVLRPQDFRDGVASVSLDNFAEDESVVVIPVYASQALEPDSFRYQLEVEGIEAQSWVSKAPLLQQTKAFNAEIGHLQFLNQASQMMKTLAAQDLMPIGQSAQGLQTQGFDRCPAPYTVGKSCEFWVMSGQNFIPIRSTLMQVSENAYWFIQNEDLADFSKADLASLARDFEAVTVPTIRRYFGNFADIDQNDKIIMIFSRLLAQDGLLGYVAPWDYFRDAEVAAYGVRSNEGDIFYAATPDSFKQFVSKTEFIGKVMPATMTHELKHLVAQGYRFMNNYPIEELWLEEPSAVAAEELAGQGTAFGGAQGLTRFAFRNPEQYRIVYKGRPTRPEENLSIYGYNFMLLWQSGERLGHDTFWRSLVQQNLAGVKNLELSAGKPLQELMLDWAPTLLFDNTFLLEGYEFESLNLRDGSWQKLAYKPLQNTTGITRSLAYYLGKGQGRHARVQIRSSDREPFVIVIRFKGQIP